MLYITDEGGSVMRVGLHIYPWSSRRASIGGRFFWKWAGMLHLYSLRYSGRLKKWRFRRQSMTQEEEERGRREIESWRSGLEA